MRTDMTLLRTIRAGRTAALGALAIAGLLSACDTTVTSPDVLAANKLKGAAALPTQLAGAYGDFAQAYLGSGYAGVIDAQAEEGQIVVSGLLTDEMKESDFFTNHLQIDLRAQSRDNETLDDLWYLLQGAREASELTAANYVTYDSTNVGRLTVLNLAGFSDVLLAESFCSNIPLSSTNIGTGKVQYAPPVSTDSVLRVAKAHFLQVIALAATDTPAYAAQYEGLRATVGLARALTFEGKLDSAATVAHLVPDGYADSIERSVNSPGEQNGVYYYTNIEVRYSVVSSEGGNGLPFLIDGANGDPRINIGAPNISTLIGYDDFTVDTIQQKFPAYGSTGQLATATEARLIEAEYAIQTGSYGSALTLLNQARQDASPGMAPLASIPHSFASAIDTLFAERAYDLWLTGHREGDLRRLVRPTSGTLPGYGRDQSTVWPTGAYFKNGTYGTNVTLLIPRNEDNNPFYTDAGCQGGNTP